MLYVVGLIGVAAFAASGVLSAARRGMDLIGVTAIALVTAIGGGTLRDVLLDRPVFWLGDRRYLWVGLISAAATLVWVRFRHPPHRALLVADALGLALFAISGTQMSEESGQAGIVAVLMGVLTGTAGGVVRDVLSAEIPLVFRPGRLYVTAVVVGASAYLLLQAIDVSRNLAAAAGMVTIAALRFAAIRWDVRLPLPQVPHAVPEDDI